MDPREEHCAKSPKFPEQRLIYLIDAGMLTAIFGFCLLARLFPDYARDLGTLTVSVVGVSLVWMLLLEIRLRHRKKHWRQQAAEEEQTQRLIQQPQRANLGIHNTINGPVSGSVVQVGFVEGGVHVSSPSSVR